METAYGLSIPRTVEEACDPQRMALLVYDMQVGVVGQIDDGAAITRRVVSVVGAARAGGFRVVYTRHMFLPKRMSGVSALRTAMAWQRVDTVAEVQPFLLRDAAGFDLVPELAADIRRACPGQAQHVGVHRHPAGYRSARLRH